MRKICYLQRGIKQYAEFPTAPKRIVSDILGVLLQRLENVCMQRYNTFEALIETWQLQAVLFPKKKTALRSPCLVISHTESHQELFKH
jgi:hypothetical protein